MVIVEVVVMALVGALTAATAAAGAEVTGAGALTETGAVAGIVEMVVEQRPKEELRPSESAFS